MELLADPAIWAGFLTLVVLELVLGIDNLVFIAILVGKLPPEHRDKARVLGLSLALGMRLALLAVLSWIMGLTRPLVTVFDRGFSGRDLILLGGGLFLLYKATTELHAHLEGGENGSGANPAYAGFGMAVVQIVALDLVFSLDSVITAVGMVNDLPVMMAAVIVAVMLMLVASKPLTTFVNSHPTVVVLALGFLLVIGFSLVADGLGFHIPKGYLYAAIGFSILIETLNQWARRKQAKAVGGIPARQRTTDAVMRLLGGEDAGNAPGPAVTPGDRLAGQAPATGLYPAEQDMIRGVLRLAERPVTSLMVPRDRVVWIDAAAGRDHAREVLASTSHTRMLVSEGALDNLRGVVQSRDLLAALLEDGGSVLDRAMRQPLRVPEATTALQALELVRGHPIPLAVVCDADDRVAGLFTANDLLAAIAGDLADTRTAATATPDATRTPN
ncbi:CBS domain-containing protein [Lysobacter sp. GX 14042]|uniref:TerC family protein n=1 Tax=Lysobacter sp. GX 14042 TaxID=2907155 RepID=UPI001F1F457F|nr:CBS domain-containing protein [Lysobacter sp. GX 14042]MCE7032206.1 CBS domain-containing protein [Lysobacter sp. GX 14042]